MFESFLTSYFLQPRVTHRLPGRLRVSIPALHKIDKLYHTQFEDLLSRLLLLLEGIEDVQVNCLSGRILIQYQTDTLSEEDVLGWLKKIGKVIIREKDHFIKIPIDKMPEVINRILDIFSKSIHYRLDLSKEVVIPNDVWS